MKLIILSSPITVPNEHQIIHSLFEEGMEIFHLHKPEFTKEEIKNFIQAIPFKYHSKITLHSDFPKFHSLEELKQHLPLRSGQYAFLSPIFDSISKPGYKSSYEFQELTQKETGKINAISGNNIIALGGIDEDKIETCRELGFAGVAILGAIWNSKSPVEKFKRIKQLCGSQDKK